MTHPHTCLLYTPLYGCLEPYTDWDDRYSTAGWSVCVFVLVCMCVCVYVYSCVSVCVCGACEIPNHGTQPKKPVSYWAGKRPSAAQSFALLRWQENTLYRRTPQKKLHFALFLLPQFDFLFSTLHI